MGLLILHLEIEEPLVLAFVLEGVLSLLPKALHLHEEGMPIRLQLVLHVPDLVAFTFRSLLLRLEAPQITDLALLGGHLERGGQLLREDRGYGDLQDS